MVVRWLSLDDAMSMTAYVCMYVNHRLEEELMMMILMLSFQSTRYVCRLIDGRWQTRILSFSSSYVVIQAEVGIPTNPPPVAAESPTPGDEDDDDDDEVCM